jgi:hypothetical protein
MPYMQFLLAGDRRQSRVAHVRLSRMRRPDARGYR